MKSKSLIGIAFTFFLLLVAQASLPVSASAQVPGIINYQGRVVDGGTNFDGLGLFKFALVSNTSTLRQATATATLTGPFVTSYTITDGGAGYTSTPVVSITGGGGSGAIATANVLGGVVIGLTPVNAGTGYTSLPTVAIAPPGSGGLSLTLWSNDGSSVGGNEPMAAVPLTVTKGLYSVLLGDTSIPNMSTAIMPAAFANSDVQLRVWFNDGTSGFQQLSPDQRLSSVGYALNAAMASVAASLPSTSDVIAQRLDIGMANAVNGADSSIAGGSNNVVNGSLDFIGGGQDNVVSNDYATIGGGETNIASALFATVAGGKANNANGKASTVSGGLFNTASNVYATVGGGDNNVAGGAWATVSGGDNNIASGFFTTVPGGDQNVASGTFSFAAGQQAQALHQGAFVWADSQGAPFASTTNDQFSARAQGGVRFFSNPGATLGAQLAPNATAWTALSDRNAKEHIEAISVRDILEELVAMPISKWNYKDDPAQRRYIGPMAQDFHSAFGLGDDDKRISTLDSESVALAAIQGLNQKLEQTVKEKDGRISELEQQMAELKAQVKAISERIEQSKSAPAPAVNVRGPGGM